MKSEFVEIRSIRFSFSEISNVVESFYKEVARDPILSVPFKSVTDWPHHIENLTHFWWTRFGGRAFLDVQYNPVGKHFEAGFNQEFLDRWLELFHKTLEQKLTPTQATIWLSIAESMGYALSRNNEMMKQQFLNR